MGYAIKINDKYEYAVKTNKSLIKRNKELVHENRRLKKTEDVFNYVFKTLGPEKVRDIVVRVKALERSKEQEKERERERAWKRSQMSR